MEIPEKILHRIIHRNALLPRPVDNFAQRLFYVDFPCAKTTAQFQQNGLGKSASSNRMCHCLLSGSRQNQD